jgi:hypothetical protein
MTVVMSGKFVAQKLTPVSISEQELRQLKLIQVDNELENVVR